MKTRKAKDWWNELSEEQKLIVLKGLKDIEDGNVMSSSEFWEKLKNGDKGVMEFETSQYI